MKKLYHTNYWVAVHWLDNSLVLCNHIPKIDDSVWDNFEPIVDLAHEPEYDDDGEEIKPRCSICGTELEQQGPDMVCPECDNGLGGTSIYQWFITDCSQADVEYLTQTFGLLFTYSELLDCYILCVTQFGTRWLYIDWTTTNPNAERKCGEKI